MGKVVVAMFTIFALLMGAPMDADAARYPRSNTRHNHSQPHDYHAHNHTTNMLIDLICATELTPDFFPFLQLEAGSERRASGRRIQEGKYMRPSATRI